MEQEVEEEDAPSKNDTKAMRFSDSHEDDFCMRGGNFERKGTFVGTAYYVSPEMLNHNTASAASDLWAFGCIIYRMLFGKTPFEGSSDY
jgi:serine/threonine protein kinase